MFLTKQYHPNQPVDIQLYSYDERTREVQPKVISVRDSFPYNTIDREPLCAAPKGKRLGCLWPIHLHAHLLCGSNRRIRLISSLPAVSPCVSVCFVRGATCKARLSKALCVRHQVGVVRGGKG